jgi:hypothetical protein
MGFGLTRGGNRRLTSAAALINIYTTSSSKSRQNYGSRPSHIRRGHCCVQRHGAALAKQLGFAPVKLGKLNEGGALVHARGRIWGQLIFQDLFKKEQ